MMEKDKVGIPQQSGYMQHTSVVGLPRCGKTTLISKIFAQIQHKAIFVNTQWENYFNTVPNSIKVWHWNKNLIINNIQKIVWNVQNRNEYWDLLKDVYANQRSNPVCQPITVITDECHLFFPKYFNIFNNEDERAKMILEIFTLGLKFNIRMIVITQKPQFCSTDVYSLCERMIVFKLHPKDVKHFERCGIHVPLINEKYKFEIIG